MKRNMGIVDRVARMLLVLVVLLLFKNGVISGVLATVLGLLAVVFLITSLLGFCPLYLPLKISTKKEK
jgi:hypothetical protein